MTIYQRDNTYADAFTPISVYGNALELLKRQASEPNHGLHLDIGCGFGPIAEPVTEALGRSYVGCDLGDLGLASLASRGFETHKVGLSDHESTYRALNAGIAGRPVASITIIDTLEHVHDPIGAIRALRQIAVEHHAVVVISVPNTAHRDIGFRLLFGQWDYTEAGILDYTHRYLFSDSVLRRLLAHTGLRIVDSFDYLQATSDQAFPAEHPMFQWAANLGQFMRALRASADQYGDANQLVRLCVPSEPAAIDPFVGRGETVRPFLSIVMRTQGNRIDSLTEILTCLTGQSVTDFEILLMGHKLDAERTAGIERLILDQPDWFRNKIRFIRVDHGGRSAPLNVGFAEANGDYIMSLDDDDTVFGHWVETFRDIARESPGRILRSVAVTQTVSRMVCRGVSGVRAVSKMDRPFREDFDWFETLRLNHSPFMTLGFPRGLFHQLGLKFDEDLSTTEDWDYLLRSGALVGVAGAPTITAVYRFWQDSQSSSTLHAQSEWVENYNRINDRFDNLPTVLWPVGTSKRIRDLLTEVEVLRSRRTVTEVAVDDSGHVEHTDRVEALREVVNIYNSTSWTLSAPIRLLGRLAGKPSPNLDEIWWLSAYNLRSLAASLRASTSWRLTAPLRLLGR